LVLEERDGHAIDGMANEEREEQRKGIAILLHGMKIGHDETADEGEEHTLPEPANEAKERVEEIDRDRCIWEDDVGNAAERASFGKEH